MAIFYLSMAPRGLLRVHPIGTLYRRAGTKAGKVLLDRSPSLISIILSPIDIGVADTHFLVCCFGKIDCSIRGVSRASDAHLGTPNPVGEQPEMQG
jgi:hypothetical protein